MARPWRPDKPRGPRPTFHKKEKPPKKALTMLHKAGSTKASPYKDGLIRIMLDDERPCPAGWTLVKDVPAFIDLLDTIERADIAAITLDWHLGVGVTKGTAAAEHLAELFRDHLVDFAQLRIVHCHSSDIQEAGNMARTIAAPLREQRSEHMPYVMVDVGHPHVEGWRVW